MAQAEDKDEYEQVGRGTRRGAGRTHACVLAGVAAGAQARGRAREGGGDVRGLRFLQDAAYVWCVARARLGSPVARTHGLAGGSAAAKGGIWRGGRAGAGAERAGAGRLPAKRGLQSG